MALTMSGPERAAAYSHGALALFMAAGVVLSALAFEHIGGYRACELCLMQRWAYYAAVPSLFAGLVLLSADRTKLAGLIFLLVAFAFLANAGLGVYQAGAEWKFWPGPSTCSGDQGVTNDAGSLLGSIAKTRVVRCDEPEFRMFGLSFAGWNVLTSFFLFAVALKAAFLSAANKG